MQNIQPPKTENNWQTYILSKRPSRREYSVKIPTMLRLTKSMDASIITISIVSTKIFCSAIRHFISSPYGEKLEVLFYQTSKQGKEVPLAIFELDEFKIDQTTAIPCDVGDVLGARFISDCDYVTELFKYTLTTENKKDTNIRLRISLSVGDIIISTMK